MKESILLAFLIATTTAHAEIEMVPLDIDLGLWETNAEMLENGAMTKILESVPEAQRAMMKEMMGSKMKIPATEQCITDDTFKDLEKKMRESMGDQEGSQNCEFKVTSSSSKEFSGTLDCEGMSASIATKVINSRLQESTVESMMAGIGATKIKMTARWKAETCPAGS